MTLTTFLKEHQSKLKTTQKLVVRDLDETSKNVFVAYVDENSNSYDVQLVLDSKKNIKESSCDCENGGTCHHIIAFVQFLVDNKKEKTGIKKPVKRKLSEIDQVLETVDNATLRLWVSETLNKNKELAFVFKNNFAPQTIEIDASFIKKIISESVTSVIGKRKTIETNEVKKIVDVLTIALKPAFDFIFAKVSKENHELFIHLITEIEGINYQYYTSGSRIKTLVKNITDQQLKSIFNLKDVAAWQNAVQYYAGLIFKDKFLILELDLVKKIYEFSKTNDIQNHFVVTTLEQNFNTIYENYKESFLIPIFELEHFLLNVYAESKIFESHAFKFTPRKFQIEHNLLLIVELIKINQLETAEKYCLEQIEQNSKSDYDLPYVKFLIHIYKKTNDTQKLANVLSIYGKFIFSIEEYLFIKEHATAENFKRYRASVMINARNSYQNGNLNSFNFYFEIKKLDDKRNDLFEMLKNAYNLTFVNEYKEIALQLSEIKFINLLSEISFFSNAQAKLIDEIADFVVKNIERASLIFILKKISFYSKNNIILTIEEKIKISS
jgi:hypothetical protein